MDISVVDKNVVSEKGNNTDNYKRNKLLLRVGTWMDLKNIMPGVPWEG